MVFGRARSGHVSSYRRSDSVMAKAVSDPLASLAS